MSPGSARNTKRRKRALLVIVGIPIFTLLALQLHLLLSQEPTKTTVATLDSPSNIGLTETSNGVNKNRRNQQQQELTLKIPTTDARESLDSPSKTKSSKKLLTEQPSYGDTKKDLKEIVSLQTPLVTRNDDNDSIPSHTIKASKKLFSQLPPTQNHSYYMDCGNDCHSVTRAFRILGWTRVNFLKEAHVTWTFHIYPKKYTKKFASWQRYNHLLTTKQWHEYLFQLFHTKRNELPFVLETYNMPNDAFLLNNKRLVDGLNHQDWMLKSDSHVSLLPQNNSDKLLKNIMEEGEEYQMVQAAVCNEMSWKGEKWFELEVYWFVASTDPLVVFYMDGYVWIGDYKDSTKRTMEAMWSEASFDDLEQVLAQQYKGNNNLIANPIMHVRNQMKQAIGRIAAEFPQRDNSTIPAEDSFELFSAGFVLDDKLNVFLSNLYHQVFLGEEYYFRLQLHHEMNYGIISILQEIWAKQEAGEAIFPLKNSGRWQVVFADGWKYEYKGHENLPLEAKTC